MSSESSLQTLRARRIVAPVAGRLRLAGGLSVLAGMVWPLQAALLAWAVSGWTEGSMSALYPAALGVVGLGLLRAALAHRVGGILHAAGDRTLARERAALIRREARTPATAGSAAVAALAAQKLPLLLPWITRFQVAMIRVRVLPLLLLALTFWISWVAGLILLVADPLIPVFMALVGMAAEQASRRQMDEIGSMNAMLMERLSALLDIRLLGATDRAAGDFATRAEALRARTMEVLRLAFLSSAVLELFAALGVAMMAVYVGFSLLGELRFGTWGTPMTLAQGLFLLLIAPEFFQPLRDLAAAWHDRAAGLSVAADLAALEAEPRSALIGSGDAAEPLPGALSLRTEGAVAELPGGQALRLPDLVIGPQDGVALVGPSGAGKSTALMAIAGLLPLRAGRIEVCGAPLDEGNADRWRARLSIIPQRVHFPDMPLADWLSPEGADPWPALKLAHASQVVDRLPDGLRTRLGETGGGVSGGEARRLMVARAVLAGGDLVLADEPTADLDPDTAALVIEALNRLRQQGRALIVATHDPALAGAMDRQVQLG